MLGVDFGLKNIGIAVGQTVTGHGNGLTTLKAKNGNPVDWLELKALIDDYQPMCIRNLPVESLRLGCASKT